MARKMSELVVKLTDQVSGPARKVAEALKAAERQTKAIASAMKVGISNRFAADMQRVGASGQQIDRVTRAWEKYRREARLSADATKWTKDQIGQVRAWERAHIAALRNVNAAKKAGAGSMGGPASQSKLAAAVGAGATAIAAPIRYVGPAVAAYATGRAVRSYAEAERAIARIGITADATGKEISAVGSTAHRIANEVAMPYANVVTGLDVLVAQGRNLKDSLDFLPSVARTAAAAGAEIDDIAKTADSVSSNFKIAGRDMQKAFDIMAAGGKAGQFELKDMARYLPSLGPAAAAAGFTGDRGLTELVSMLQIMRKGSGTSEEAAGSMSNILQKMMSEETTKRFKKFGVDLPKAMEKAKKEGRNLVEVFEELTHQATKGDLSKIPQLINDMEFARGVRALMSYRGEWQKLSGTIQKTAPGSVVNDLSRVTNDAQAKLDRMGNTLTRTWQNLGRVVHDVTGGLAPLREMSALIERIYDHDDKAPKTPQQESFNRLVNQAVRGFDTPEEWDSAQKGRLAKAERDAVDAKLAEYDQKLARAAGGDHKRLAQADGKIAAHDAAAAARSKNPVTARLYRERDEQIRRELEAERTKIAAEIESRVGAIRAERDRLKAALSARDKANVDLVENDAQLNRAKTRMGLSVTGDKPTPIAPGLGQFGFGLNGTTTPGQPSQTMQVRGAKGKSVTVPLPLPPARPASLPKAVPTLESFDDIYSPPKLVKPEVDSSAIEAAKDKAAEAKTGIEGLDLTVKPIVDTGSLREALSYAQAITQELRRIPGLVANSAGPIRRGRSEVATATANLRQSRLSNAQDRPFLEWS